jgi:hypothetical protein
MAATFAVGAKVTVNITPDDPLKLCMSPHVTIAEVRPEGYLVWHRSEWNGQGEPIRYGPIPEARLTPGWPPVPAWDGPNVGSINDRLTR